MREERPAREQLDTSHFHWQITGVQIQMTKLESAYAAALNKYVGKDSGQIATTF